MSRRTLKSCDIGQAVLYEHLRLASVSLCVSICDELEKECFFCKDPYKCALETQKDR